MKLGKRTSRILFVALLLLSLLSAAICTRMLYIEMFPESHEPGQGILISVLNSSDQELKNLQIIWSGSSRTVNPLRPGESQLLMVNIDGQGGDAVYLYDADHKLKYGIHTYFVGVLLGSIDVEINGINQGVLTGFAQPRTQADDERGNLLASDN